MNKKVLNLSFIVMLFALSLLAESTYTVDVLVYDSSSGGSLLWSKTLDNVVFIDDAMIPDPIGLIRSKSFASNPVFVQLIVDGELLDGPRVLVNTSASLMREHEPMDELEMGIQIGEPGNDVAVRSDRLVVGAGDPNEKITVEGALSIQEQDLPPGTSIGFGKIFIDNTDNHLYYIDESGNITDLTVDGNAVQSVSSSANVTGRMEHMRFIPGEATEITESATDDTIYIRYDVNVTTTGPDPCTAAPSMPSAIDGPSLVCSGEPGTSYSIAPVDGATYYRWSLPSGSNILSGSGTNAIHAILGSSDGSVSVTAVNSCGESSPRTKAISINRPTSPGPITGDALVCSGATGINYFIATVPDATNYIWTLPAGAVLASGTGSPSITANFGTLGGDICVQTENSCGISSPVCMPITITDTPEIPGTITGSTNVCNGATGVSYSVDAVAEATSYSWSLPTGASITAGSGTRSITVDFGSASGDISVTASSICGTSPARSLSVTVTSPPATPGSISGSTVVPPNSNDVAYSISPVTGATSYLWTVTGDATIDGSATSTSINVDFGTSSGTTVDVCVSASNSCGTSSERCETVTIEVPSGSVTFDYTGSSQTWTVPLGITEITVDAKGARGGGSHHGLTTRGYGGRVQSDLSVSGGDVLYIYVGGQGEDGSTSGSVVIANGGFNGGGNGGCVSSSQHGGAGGGASDIRLGGTALSDRILVAGGAGGAGDGWSIGNRGGHGGGLTGGSSLYGSNCTSSCLGGTNSGGTQTAGGIGSGCGGGHGFTNGAFGQGGEGPSGSETGSGGGGGGGWYGGAGAAYCGGGGGSSYVDPSHVIGSPVHTQGANNGNGQIIISW